MSEAIRPAQLWRSLPSQARFEAALAFWTDEQAALEHAEGVALIARQIKFRPKSVLAMPVDRKARHLASMGQLSDLLAARLLVAYHLKTQRPMMSRFLDLLGIPHTEGVIEDDSLKPPEPAALDAAVATLAQEFPREDVARYLQTLLWQDPDTWGGLQGRPELSP